MSVPSSGRVGAVGGGGTLCIGIYVQLFCHGAPLHRQPGRRDVLLGRLRVEQREEKVSDGGDLKESVSHIYRPTVLEQLEKNRDSINFTAARSVRSVLGTFWPGFYLCGNK